MDTRSKQVPRGAATADAISVPRRRFLGALTVGLTGGVASLVLPTPARTTPNPPPPLHLQDCRIAGSQYYACHTVLPHLHVGDTLQLRRQPDNPHDPRAIEVFWRQHKLGYLPRLDNAAAASLADRTHALHVEIIGIDDPEEAWEPVRLQMWASPA